LTDFCSSWSNRERTASEEEKPKARPGRQGEIEVDVYRSTDQVTGALLLHFVISEELNVSLPRD